MLDTGTPERLNYYINIQQKKENTDNDKVKFLPYCFELVFISCVYISPIMHGDQDAKIGHSSRTLLEILRPSTDHECSNVNFSLRH